MLRQKGPSLRSKARTAGRWRSIPGNQEQAMPPESQVLRLRSGRQRSEDSGPVAQQCCAQDVRGDEIFSERLDKRQINYIYLQCVREMLNYDNGRKTIIGAWWSHQAFIYN